MFDVADDSINISLADSSYISKIIELGSSFHISTLSPEDKKNGFLDCPIYTPDELSRIIYHKGMAIAQHNNQVVGYYLIDNWSENVITQTNKKIVNELIQKGVLPADKRIAPRVQIVVKIVYQNIGLPKRLLNFLIPTLSCRFDILFSIGVASNPKKHSHIKSGWKMIYEDNEFFYIAYNL